MTKSATFSRPCPNPLKKNPGPKLSVAANQRGKEALRSLAKKGILQTKKVQPVLKHLVTAAKSIEQRIKELRSKVWWDGK